MKHILSIAYSRDSINFDEIINFRGEKFRLTQYSTNFDFDVTKDIVHKFEGQCDAICINGIPPKLKMKGGAFVHPQSDRIKGLSRGVPIVDGQLIKDIYIPWAIRQFYFKNKKLLSNKKMAFYSGAFNSSLLDVVEEFDNEVFLADPYFYLKLPFNVKGKSSLEKFIKFLAPVLKNLNLKRSNVADFTLSHGEHTPHLKEFFSADVFVGNETTFNLIDLQHLRGKTVVIDFLSPGLESKFTEIGVKDVIVCMPRLIDNRHINFSVLHAIFQTYQEDHLRDDDVIRWIEKLELSSELRSFSKKSSTSAKREKFAFIIHPLSTDHLFKHPLLKKFSKLKKPLGSLTEEVLALSPGFFYGTIKGIKSEKNGKGVEGLIYSVTETPRKLLEKEPQTIYKKLVNLAKEADKRGAGIIGLGAYTKIVGDAGVTVANLSPIPVTTGNSLSAASTLWAAKFAIEKMGLVKNVDNTYLGQLMVVGATGSIGAVSAKILAKSWNEIILVAPRAYKLLELKEEILNIAPNAEIKISTSADSFSHECDLIITTTSAQGGKVLNIEDVKSGCVICDVSRPFDISLEDSLLRPDVMVIASGEVQLPGEIKSNVDLGLEGNIVYACLAETALLAMEGKLESFTLSRNINYEKVLEIDRMAKDHGVRLSCIMGHSGFITDEEFELCRAHATNKLSNYDS